ncbi:MAG: molybdenum cofactor biosynthesis protein MoaE [Methylococcaceae bacterium]|nr:molybdenum cofactor biosynthesis protein MoaE [Methylococcaceae bacterium]
MKVKIVETTLNPWQEVEDYQQEAIALRGKFGATNIFIGTMRDFNEGDEVTAMTLEHYAGMTEKQLENIIKEAMQQWDVLDVLIVHRVGELLPNQPIVLVAVWTSHRGDAFDASRYIMEALKTKAPFWKKETLVNGSRWVDKNTDGYKKS